MIAKIRVWKSILILKFEGLTREQLDSTNLLRSDQDKLVEFIKSRPSLAGFINYSEKKKIFTMGLSVQNFRRLRQTTEISNLVLESGHKELQRLKELSDKLPKVVKISEDIKSGKFDHVNIDYKLPPLAEYQHRGTVFLTFIPSSPMFADCGCGKTFMVLVSTQEQIKRGFVKPGKTLVCGKLATLETGWSEDTKKFTNLKSEILWEASNYKRKEKLLKKLESDADIFFINHDGVRVLKDELIAQNFEKIVVDESTVLKSFKGENNRAKGGAFGSALMEISHNAKWRVIMSGTPAPNGPSDLWGQFRFLDPNGLLLESRIADFHQEYMDFIVFGKLKKDSQGKPIKGVPEDPRASKKPITAPDTIPRISKIINPLTFRIKARDHLDLPRTEIIKRALPMGREQLKHYKELEEAMATVIDDAYVSVQNKLSELSKLRQVTGGFLRDHEQNDHLISDAPKLSMLDDLVLEEIGSDKKIVIFAEFRWEIETIISRYKDLGVVSVYGGNNQRANLQNIKDFIEKEDVKIIVLHPKSAAHGITFTIAHYLIFYSFSHSAENDYQCIKRIERAGQKQSMFVYYLLCKDSLDEAIYRVIRGKNRNQEKLIDQEEVNTKLLENWRSYGRKGKGKNISK